MKHIGWFDQKENTTSVLTSAMSEDSHILNGIGTESIGPALEGGFALITGILIGFVMCWQEALVCLAVSPFLIAGNAMQGKLQKGLSQKKNEIMKDANLLCGDAITNFKTV